MNDNYDGDEEFMPINGYVIENCDIYENNQATNDKSNKMFVKIINGISHETNIRNRAIDENKIKLFVLLSLTFSFCVFIFIIYTKK